MVLFTYSKLINYRAVIKEVKMSHWWILARKIPRMQLKIRRVMKLITGEHCLNSNPANNIVQGMLVNYAICAPVLKKETVVQNNFYLSVMLFVKYGQIMPSSIKRYFNSGDNLHKLHFILIDICYE